MKKILIGLAFVLLISPKVYATDIMNTFDYFALDEKLNIESDIFPEFSLREMVGDMVKGQGVDVKEILKEVVIYFIKSLTSSLKLLFCTVTLGFAVSMINTLKSERKNVSEIAFYILYSIFASFCVFSFTKAIGPAKEMLEGIFIIITQAIPILLSLLTMSGGITTSAVVAPSMLSMIEVINLVINSVVLPLIISSVAISCASNMSDRIKLSNMVSVMKQSSKWILGFVMSVYIGFYGIYSLGGSAVDNKLGKAAKFAIGSGVPVVGGIISESIETVVSVLGAVRNLAGIGIICLIILAVATPVIKTIVYMWSFKLSAVILEPITDKRIINLINDIGDAISLITGVIFAVCLLFTGTVGILLLAGNFVV